MAYLKATVQGQVQGVGFRWFVRSVAQRLGVRGVVRNLPGGDVEVEVVGELSVLEDFADQLWRGPGDVTNVESSWANAGPAFVGFRITF